MEINPYFWAILATVGTGAWGLVNRKILAKEKDYIATGGLNELISLFIIAIIFIFLGSGLSGGQNLDISSIPFDGWLALAISFAAYPVAIFLTYKAFQTAEASERAVVNQLQNFWVVALGAIFLGEAITGNKIIGVALVVLGAIICTYRKEKMRWKVEGVMLFAIASLFFAVGILADKVALKYFPIYLYAFVAFVSPAAIGIIMMGKNWKKRMERIFARHGGWIVLLAVASVFPYMTYLLALASLPASVVGPIMNTNVVLAALGGMLLLNEKEGWKQKIIGALLAFAGAAMLGG